MSQGCVFRMDYTEVPFDFLVQLAATDKLAQAEIERRIIIGLASKKSLKHADHDQSEHGNWAHDLPVIRDRKEIWNTDAYKRLIEKAKLANPEGKVPGPIESRIEDPRNSYGPNAHLTFIVHESNVEMVKDVFRELGYQDKHMQTKVVLTQTYVGFRPGDKIDDGMRSVRVPWAKPAKSLKHGDHDQSTHGNRDGAGVSSAPQTFSEVLSLATGTKDGGELLTKVLEARGVSMKPQLAKLTGSDRIYRGVTTDEAARSFLSGEAPIMGGYPMGDDGRLEPYTWGAGFYATTDRDEAVSYRGDNGRVIEMEFSPEAKILRGELAWDQVPDMPDDWSKQEWEEFNGTISDLKNAYWASQGYDAIDLGREIVILNPSAIIADVSTAESVGVDSGRKSPFDNKSLKHGDHDQSDHGSWAHGGATDRSGGNVAKYIQAHGLKTTVSTKTVANRDAKEKSCWQIAKDAVVAEKKLPANPADDTKEIREQRIANGQIYTAATILAQGYAAMAEVPGDNWKVIEVFAPDGSLAAAGMGTLQDQYDGGKAFALRFFGSLGTVEGAGTAIMAKSLEIAAEAGAEYRLIKVQSGSFGWYKQWGFDTEGSLAMTKDQVAEWATNYRAAQTKSLKHLPGEHDQDDHGSWATGITGGKQLPAAEFAAKLVARAAEARGGKSGIQQLDLSNTSSFAEIKSASDRITSAIDKEIGDYPSAYAQPRVEPTEQQKFLKQFSDGSDLMRNTLYSANEGAINRNKDFQFFVATGVDGTTPVGTLVYRNFTRENVGNNPYLTGHEDKWMELTNIGTNGLEPGVGTRLVTQVLGAAAERGRGVWLNDPYDTAASFYRGLGFEMKYKQGDWIGYMEPETVQEWWKSYEAAGGK